MEIKIRNIDKSIVARLDDIAQKSGKSRNEVAKEIIISAIDKPWNSRESEYRKMAIVLSEQLKENTELFEKISKLMAE